MRVRARNKRGGREEGVERERETEKERERERERERGMHTNYLMQRIRMLL